MNIFKKAWETFLTIFGDIHISKYPLWILYDPVYFKMTGSKILDIAQGIKPGDIIIRGYDGYADTYFIPQTKEHGRYSHAGLYIGNNQIIHAIAPNVDKIDIIEFCECDRIAVLRPVGITNDEIQKAIDKAKSFLDSKVGYDFDFKSGSENLYCFELCAESYKDILDIPKLDASICLGLIKRKNCYLAESFFQTKQLNCVFEYNPSKKLDQSILNQSK